MIQMILLIELLTEKLSESNLITLANSFFRKIFAHSLTCVGLPQIHKLIETNLEYSFYSVPNNHESILFEVIRELRRSSLLLS